MKVHGRSMFRSRSIGLACLVVSYPLFAQAAAPSRYDACIAKVAADPNEAFENALAWQTLGGGTPAKHCAALALIAAGHPGEGAVRLERIAADPGGAGNALRAEALSQAGDAWVAGADYEAALRDYRAAAQLAHEAGLGRVTEARYRLNRAEIALMAGYASEALIDAGSAIDLAPTAGAYTLRARLRREARDFGAAAADIDAALRLAPGAPDTVLERGLLARDQGRLRDAREDLLDVILADEKSPLADLARQVLQDLDLPPS